MFVLHDCPDGDNPLCVNPDHLRLGTAGDNSRDAAKKGRIHAKLTADDVRSIRQRFAAREATMLQLAAEYGVGGNSIQNVIRRVTWKHVP
jgi:hypothetical protein